MEYKSKQNPTVYSYKSHSFNIKATEMFNGNGQEKIYYKITSQKKVAVSMKISEGMANKAIS